MTPDASVLFIVLKSALNCRKHLLFRRSMLIQFFWASIRMYQNCFGVIRRSFQSGCSFRINLMFSERGKFPDVGKTPDGPMKRCNVLVFEMCSSIKFSFAVGKKYERTSPQRIGPCCWFLGRCFYPVQERDRGEEDGLLLSCGFR